MIRNVIFDVDGTLVDSNKLHAEAWQRAFARYNKKIGFDAILRQIGKGGDQLMPVFLTPAELDGFGSDLEKYRGELFQKDYLSKVKPFPDVRRLIERIKQNHQRIALASSAKEEEVEAFKRITNIADLLDETTSSDDAASSKPEPDIFLAALAKLGHPPKETCVVVGDTPYDAMAAKKAGLKMIGVTCGGWSAKELLEAGCTETFENPSDLLKRFDQSLLGKHNAIAAKP